MKRAAPVRKALLAGGVLGYVGLATLATLYASAMLYPLMHKQLPQQVSARTMFGYWQVYGAQPQERKKLLLAIGAPAMGLFVLLPLGVAAAGQRRRELHGSARFANASEVHQAGLHADRGILLGKLQDRFLVLPGQQSVLVAAPTRSWKGVAIVVPNLLVWPDSACVIDIKRENFRITAGYRARHQAVYVWAPFADDARGHRWNPLSSVRSDPRFAVGDLLRIAHVLYPSVQHGSSTENFFNGQARNLFLGLGLLLVETPALPRTLGELLRQGSGKGRAPEEHLRSMITERQQSGCALSHGCEDALMRFLASSEQTRASILSTFNEPLTVFSDLLVDAATAGSDFAIEDVRRRRMTVYLCIPPNRLEDAAVLLNLFFSQLIGLNTDRLPEDDPSLKYQCLLCLDEAAAMGRVGILAKAIGYLAGYGLRVLTVCQAGSQIKSVYGEKDAQSFVTNHAAQVLFAPREQRDANEYSEMLGTFTERSESRGRSRSHGGRGGGSSTSTNTSPQRRALMLPQEMRELGVQREIVVIENLKPILADKICYYTDPVLKTRLLAPPELPPLRLVEPSRARTEDATVPERPVAFEELVIDVDLLPDIPANASEAELARFVEAFLAQLRVEDLAAPQTGYEQLNVMERAA